MCSKTCVADLYETLNASQAPVNRNKMTSYEPKNNRAHESISSFKDLENEHEQEQGSYKSEEVHAFEPVPGEVLLRQYAVSSQLPMAGYEPGHKSPWRS